MVKVHKVKTSVVVRTNNEGVDKEKLANGIKAVITDHLEFLLELRDVNSYVVIIETEGENNGEE